MSHRYGQSITWSTPSAPRPFSGILTAFSYEEQAQEYLDEDESGDNRALVTSGRKAALDWDAKCTPSSTDFLNLINGAKIMVSGYSSGVILAYNAVERYVLNTPKTISVRATHFPDIDDSGGDAAGSVTAFIPDPSGLSNLFPGSQLIYSTQGLTAAAGVVHGLTIEQMLEITEDDLAPDGTVPGATAHGYKMKISLDLLATSDRPAIDSSLDLTGAGGVVSSNGSAGEFKVTSSGLRFATKRGMMYRVGAIWIPAFD